MGWWQYKYTVLDIIMQHEYTISKSHQDIYLISN